MKQVEDHERILHSPGKMDEKSQYQEVQADLEIGHEPVDPGVRIEPPLERAVNIIQHRVPDKNNDPDRHNPAYLQFNMKYEVCGKSGNNQPDNKYPPKPDEPFHPLVQLRLDQ